LLLQVVEIARVSMLTLYYENSQLNTVYQYQNNTLPMREEEIIHLLVYIGMLCVCIFEQMI